MAGRGASEVEIEIRDSMIRLGQLLKLAGAVENGGEAKAAIQAGEARVNGEVETRRGRQLHAGDAVLFRGVSYRVAER
jgi:ribosome-associated protein